MKWLQFFTPAKSMDTVQTKAFISTHPSEETTILDVRQPSEYEQSHIPGAALIPLPELSDRLGELDPDKPTPGVLCGRRAQPGCCTNAGGQGI